MVRGYLEACLLPAAEERRPPVVKTAFDLVRAHLDAARRDDDYKFVLAEVDYLKPYWDVFPEDRADLRRFLAECRIEIVGGNYNEPNTNLTSVELTIRSADTRSRSPAFIAVAISPLTRSRTDTVPSVGAGP